MKSTFGPPSARESRWATISFGRSNKSRASAKRWPALKEGQVLVRIDPRYFRPAEVETLLGDATKARKQLGWKPKVMFKELVAEMASEDLRDAERESLVKKHGYRTFDHHE